MDEKLTKQDVELLRELIDMMEENRLIPTVFEDVEKIFKRLGYDIDGNPDSITDVPSARIMSELSALNDRLGRLKEDMEKEEQTNQ